MSIESWWTVERVEQLRVLHAKGLSNAAIANEMGAVSRNAVIGKVTRLGLNDGLARVKLVAVARKPAAIATERRNSGIGAQVQKINRREPKPKPLPFEAACVENASRRMLLVDMGAFDCRYPDPEGDPDQGISHTFCGHAAIIGKSYCAGHLAITCGVGTVSERNAFKSARRFGCAA